MGGTYGLQGRTPEGRRQVRTRYRNEESCLVLPQGPVSCRRGLRVQRTGDGGRPRVSDGLYPTSPRSMGDSEVPWSQTRPPTCDTPFRPLSVASILVVLRLAIVTGGERCVERGLGSADSLSHLSFRTLDPLCSRVGCFVTPTIRLLHESSTLFLFSCRVHLPVDRRKFFPLQLRSVDTRTKVRTERKGRSRRRRLRTSGYEKTE